MNEIKFQIPFPIDEPDEVITICEFLILEAKKILEIKKINKVEKRLKYGASKSIGQQ